MAPTSGQRLGHVQRLCVYPHAFCCYRVQRVHAFSHTVSSGHAVLHTARKRAMRTLKTQRLPARFRAQVLKHICTAARSVSAPSTSIRPFCSVPHPSSDTNHLEGSHQAYRSPPTPSWPPSPTPFARVHSCMPAAGSAAAQHPVKGVETTTPRDVLEFWFGAGRWGTPAMGSKTPLCDRMPLWWGVKEVCACCVCV